ncbi:ChaN family lipoprotein [Carboxylicivirga linearis]|uniref:ChaN family lipoprotein n=1 Tax=Carboxylicivirga linearis TaxID=1628157 RepID=A0ABS5JY58_9BACT|nr:ChaN family lipoprotein [Carboxylicivirga linearis]MBS2099865.1 ChaN family lipoprotein [Carboxylicivirga linearis]
MNLAHVKPTIFVFLLFTMINPAFAQKKKAYQIFTSKGKKVTYKKILKKLSAADIVFFGELHNNAIAHWLQYETTNDLLQKRELILGAEMIEADNQDALNQYLKGSITEKELSEKVRLWPNYNTDYKPLVEIAKNNQLPFIATNVPRRYASMVYKKGVKSLDTLSTKEKAWIAPLPFAYDAEVNCYKKMLSMGAGHGGDNLPKAQALKDATMAHFILKNHKADKLFLHFNGAYHSDYYEGIIWQLRQTNQKLNIVSISTVNQSQLKKLNDDAKGKADFIIVVDDNMPTTY